MTPRAAQLRRGKKGLWTLVHSERASRLRGESAPLGLGLVQGWHTSYRHLKSEKGQTLKLFKHGHVVLGKFQTLSHVTDCSQNAGTPLHHTCSHPNYVHKVYMKEKSA